MSTILDTILARVQAVAATGVDIVKVGITSGPEAAAVIDALAPLPCAIIPVFLADDGLDPLLLERIVQPQGHAPARGCAMTGAPPRARRHRPAELRRVARLHSR